MKKVLVRKNTYVDSVFLMLISRDLEKRQDVTSATVTMGTPMNIELLKNQGFNDPILSDATAADLLLAVECADDKAIETVFQTAQEMLAQKHKKGDGALSQEAPHSIVEALEIIPTLNLAVISLPGIYAARETRKALENDLHVMLFSDNVSLEDEIALKRIAHDKALLLMGPDCGTAIISGKPLCFSNIVAQGSVGIVAASGTGLQEVTCLIDRFGAGVSQAIGTGGRDLKNEKVGGLTMITAIEALGADDSTKVIVVISKPPAPEVARSVLDTLLTTGKPAVVHFIGLEIPDAPQGTLHWAKNLEETARFAVDLAENPLLHEIQSSDWPFNLPEHEIDMIISNETKSMKDFQKYIRGYYTGGTLADEAWILLHGLTGEVYSNNQVDPAYVLKDPKKSKGHTIVDLGDDIFTVGRPHPMIDPSTRTERIEAESEDPEIAVMLVDCVLGYGSHENPAGAMVPALRAAKKSMEARGGYLSIIASVTGTAEDTQDFFKQVEILRNAGIIVMPSNYQASMLAVRILEKIQGIDVSKQKNSQKKNFEKKPQAYK
ncbi:MAG: succinyl-CoA synthetase, partial [Spirochaetae bacterium HGW-Spirochaetae-8]